MGDIGGVFEIDRRQDRSERPVDIAPLGSAGPRHYEPTAQTAGLRHRCHAINDRVFEMTMRTASQNAVEDDKSLSRITAYIVAVRQQWTRMESNVCFDLVCEHVLPEIWGSCQRRQER